MTIRFALAFALVVSLAGCNSMLDQDPVDQLPDTDAITNAKGARAALVGAYNALESLSLLRRGLRRSSATCRPTTRTIPAPRRSYDDADANQFRADNGSGQRHLGTRSTTGSTGST